MKKISLIMLLMVISSIRINACSTKKFISIFDHSDSEAFVEEILDELTYSFNRAQARNIYNILKEQGLLGILVEDGEFRDGPFVMGSSRTIRMNVFSRHMRAARIERAGTNYQLIGRVLGMSIQMNDYLGEPCGPDYSRKTVYDLDHYDWRRDINGMYSGRFGLWYRD